MRLPEALGVEAAGGRSGAAGGGSSAYREAGRLWKEVSEIEVDKKRNVCVIAHVDHGKTSLCDHLVAHAGYMNRLNAGDTRYLDSREDEQDRLITIKSSAIPIRHRGSHVINLIDSPGHIDFSVEVLTAARCSDGALLVVDALEGSQSQTANVLNHAWKERLALVLVINKMDRLFTEALMQPKEAYAHITVLLEKVNSALYRCIADSIGDADVANAEFQKLEFSPERGNVLFASATDGWGCALNLFARKLAKQLITRAAPASQPAHGPPRAAAPQPGGGGGAAATGDAVLEKATANLLTQFWKPDVYLDPKTFKICKKHQEAAASAPAAAAGAGAGPAAASSSSSMHAARPCLAEAFFLAPLHAVYALREADEEERAAPAWQKKLEQVLKFTGTPRDRALDRQLQRKLGNVAKVILRDFLPLADAALDIVIAVLPSPRQALQRRASVLGPNLTIEGPTVIYLAKSLSSDLDSLRLTSDKLRGREKLNGFVGFSRIFCGRSVKSGDVLYIVDEAARTGPAEKVYVDRLFAPVGLDLVPQAEGRAGDIVCISFGEPGHTAESLLERTIKETVEELLRRSRISDKGNTTTTGPRGGFNPLDRGLTISSEPTGIVPIEPLYKLHHRGIFRVCIEPKRLEEWPNLLRGIAYLYRADPSVTVEANSSSSKGQLILCLQGEVHRDRVVQDLQMLYCPEIEFSVSPPLILLRETLADEKDLLHDPPPSHKQIVKLFPFPPWRSPLAGAEMISEETAAYPGDISNHHFRIRLKASHWKPADAVGQDPTKELAAQDPPQDPAQDPPQDPAQDPPQDPAQDPAQDPGEKKGGRGSEAPGEVKGASRKGALVFEFGGAVKLEVRAPGEKPGCTTAAIHSILLPTAPKGSGSAAFEGGLQHLQAGVSSNLRQRQQQQPEQEPEPQASAGAGSSSQSGPGVRGVRVRGIDLLRESDLGRGELRPEVRERILRRLIWPRVTQGIKLAAGSGPFCGEPIAEVQWTLEDLLCTEETLKALLAHPLVSRDPNRDAPRRAADGDGRAADGDGRAADGDGRAADGDGGQSEPDDGLDCKSVGSKSADSKSLQSFGASATLASNRPGLDSWDSALGNLVSLTKTAAHAALEIPGLFRIQEQMLLLEVRCQEEVLGKVHDLLGRRRVELNEQLVEAGSLEFLLKGTITMSESFQLGAELRQKASGQASISLQEGFWQTNPMEPFPEAVITQEDLEKLSVGQLSEWEAASNVTRSLIMNVRQRKGYPLGDKLIAASADKQRTLSRTK